LQFSILYFAVQFRINLQYFNLGFFCKCQFWELEMIVSEKQWTFDEAIRFEHLLTILWHEGRRFVFLCWIASSTSNIFVLIQNSC
jgi:hypothetical protein